MIKKFVIYFITAVILLLLFVSVVGLLMFGYTVLVNEIVHWIGVGRNSVTIVILLISFAIASCCMISDKED